MAETLVIVESPSKAKTIEKYLGSKYRVIASNGHVRDLPKSQLGVDVEHDFEPKYITLRGRGEVIEKIRKELPPPAQYEDEDAFTQAAAEQEQYYNLNIRRRFKR